MNLWTAIPDMLVQINNVPRTIQATNKISELILYLDFTHPVRNTSEELSKVLESNYGTCKILHRKSHGNRRFGFKLANVQSPAVVSVTLDSSHIISRAGTVVRHPSSVTFLYDTVRPQVKLTPESVVKTQDRTVPVTIEFTKPVFLFDAHSVTVRNGQITRFDELSKSSYTIHVFADEGRVVAISIKENKTRDITGNFNAYSNVVYVRHYVTPAVSIGLYSFTSASLIATSFAAVILAISSASLAACGSLTTTVMKPTISDPSRNLVGMVGHLQVFALSQWMAVSLPIEYLETTKGLQWLIPHAQLPWERKGTHLHMQFFNLHWGYVMPEKPPYSPKVFSIDSPAPFTQPSSKTEKGRRLGANASVYGSALLPGEYKSYFQVQILDSSSAGFTFRSNLNKGWHDFISKMFWLGTGGGALIFLHLFLLGLFKWRFRSSFRGALLPPRFELFLVIFAIPGFCQGLAFIIRGGTTGGIIVGVILLAVPAGFIFSVILFLSVAVLLGSFVQYHEVRWKSSEDACQKFAVLFVLGRKFRGTWSCQERLPSTFFSRFGLLFEDRKGPPDIVIMDSENPKSLPSWLNSGSNGIGRMREANSNDESDEAVVSKKEIFFGAGQASYFVLDLARRTLLGIVFGAYNPAHFSRSQVSIVFASTLVQLLYLLVFKPYRRRGVQAVETICMLCETLLFALCFPLLSSASVVENNENLGLVMLGLLLLSLVVQLANEWYALVNQLLRLSPSQTSSLKLGIKMLFQGLLLPLIPKRWWASLVSSLPLQPTTGLATVVPASPEVDVQADATSQGECDGLSKSETLVLPHGPGSPCFIDHRTAPVDTYSGDGEITMEFGQRQEQLWNRWDVPQTLQGKRSASTARSNEMKTLQELAKASFLRGVTDNTLTERDAVKGPHEPLTRIASPSSLVVEQQTTSSRAEPPFPARTRSENSSSDK